MKLFSSILIILILTLSACDQKKKIDPRLDDSLYERLDKGFYKGKKDGKLYIKTGPVKDTLAKEPKMIYFYKEVPPVDIPSYTRLSHAGYFAKDKNHVYIWETTSKDGESITPLNGADPATFTTIAYRWGKDTNAVYYQSNRLQGLNPAELEPVCADVMDSSMIYIDFIRDNDQLFYRQQEIKLAEGLDITKIFCKFDLMGNSFLAYGENLYVVRNNTMVLYE